MLSKAPAAPLRSAVSRLIPVGLLRPNPWNPNRVTPETASKIRASLIEHGFVDPITAWDKGETSYIIIDGEHRLHEAVGLGYTEAPVTLLTGLTEQQAKKLTLTLNELHGQPSPEKLQELLDDLLTGESPESLLQTLPYSNELLDKFLAKPIPTPRPMEQSQERWTELTFRVPVDVAEVINEALTRARTSNGDDLERWQALEVLAAEYLAS